MTSSIPSRKAKACTAARVSPDISDHRIARRLQRRHRLRRAVAQVVGEGEGHGGALRRS
jgi:hypothetical protein